MNTTHLLICLSALGWQKDGETNCAAEYETSGHQQYVRRRNKPEGETISERVAVSGQVLHIVDLHVIICGIYPYVAAYEPNDHEEGHKRVEDVKHKCRAVSALFAAMPKTKCNQAIIQLVRT